MRKIRKLYPEKIASVKSCLSKLAMLEKDKCTSTDETADCFARIMETLFSDDNDDLRALGYNLGRFIYIADAADDYVKDVAKDNYNPYRCAYPDADESMIKNIASCSMATTLSMAAECYERLNIVKNKELLDNIMYLGLRQRMDMIVSAEVMCDKKGK